MTRKKGKMMAIVQCIVLALCVTSVNSAAASASHKMIRSKLSSTTAPDFARHIFQKDSSALSAVVVAASGTGKAVLKTAATASKPVLGDIIAKALGYVIGAGSMAVYLPILLSLLKNKSSDGFSAQTWVFNLLGISLACIYPIKKLFPLSTFVELLLLVVQSVGILGLICHYQGLTKEYLAFLVVYGFAGMYAVATPIPAKVLQATQVAAILVCNYANIPQIVLTFQKKKASWSPITAAMSAAGNLIRIFTTFQLTKDPLVLSGYLLGFFTNAILLAQTMFYGSDTTK
jgi:mannose-P-dolichol utilization defect protein 1